ncbi:4Fe-4S double cluster binding domain-containing protein [Oceanispirochaeta sp.]|uniref:epoxyqueuosine reductase n=1 Tax=Oceanispirochaeta sp. TaxID=2035350 RepID=UPI0026182195|nr:4Fe-4S double cluster binding domain-containing protein [Oceanispirochaeta sp.]MDA3957291.1 hypothetical protein [Oceanispirochaeta sp.]
MLHEAGMPPQSSIISAFFPFFRSTQEKIKTIAPFALRNHYKEMILRMKVVLKSAGPPFSSLTRKEIRLFSNSRFPEKQMAALGGLGFIGRNTLLINKKYGSRGLLAGMIIPLNLMGLQDEEFSERNSEMPQCGSCRLCEEACPGGALKNHQLSRIDCLQHWTSSDGPVPEKLKNVWGQRMYGCTICQDVCPWNRSVPEGTRISTGLIDPIPNLKFYLSHSEKEIKESFRGTALGMSWFKSSHMIRNALLSAGSSGLEGRIDLIEAFTDSDDPAIRDAALWVLDRLRQDREP